jgi:aminoglycoside phosphotransferase (APT) family kinase protein
MPYNRTDLFSSHETLARHIIKSPEYLTSPDIATVHPDTLIHIAGSALEAAGVDTTNYALTVSPAFGETGSDYQVKKLTIQSVTASSIAARPNYFALRFRPSRANTEEPIYIDQEFVVSTRIRDHGIPTPEVIADTIEIDPREAPNLDLTVTSFVEGMGGYALIHKKPEAVLSVVQYLGAMLARLHEIDVDGGYGYFDRDMALEGGHLVGQCPTYDLRLQEGLTRSLQTLIENDYLTPQRAAELYELFTDSPIANKVCAEKAVLLHGDCAPHNIIVNSSDREQPYTVIDFGEAQAGPPLHDLAITSAFLTYYDYGYGDLTSRLLEAYRKNGGVLPADAEAQLTFLRHRIAVSHATLYSVIDVIKSNPHNTGRLNATRKILTRRSVSGASTQ